MKTRIFLLALSLVCICSIASAEEAPQQEEIITLTTYYPCPYGDYHELYTASNTYLAVRSGNVGIGTRSPKAEAAPNGEDKGNLDVNDVWLRGANSGAGAWASETGGGGKMTMVGGWVVPTGTQWANYDVSDADLVFLTFEVAEHANSGQYWLEKKTDGWYLSGNAIGGTYSGFQPLGTSTGEFTLTTSPDLYRIQLQIMNKDTFRFWTYAGGTCKVSITKFAFQ